jgi:hypothetical protein
MWTSKCELIDSKCIQRISIFNHDQQLSYSEVIELWQQNNNFRDFFISLLADTSMKAYFWETPPVTKSTVNRTFEFVLVNSPQLSSVRPDKSDFRQHFESANQEIATFLNLGKDALLIVPCPLAELSAYPHLASFVRKSPKSQQHLLWQTVGRELQQRLNKKPIWVSTSGLGVYWLHIRLDSYPKYYCFQPYKLS